jgi:hypothetical protein
MTADLSSLLDLYTRIANAAWWLYAALLAAGATSVVAGAGWGAWRIARHYRNRAVRRAARHRLYARRYAIADERQGICWQANAGGGDGWPVDLDAQAALYAHIDAAERLDLCELLWAMPAYDFIGEEDPR